MIVLGSLFIAAVLLTKVVLRCYVQRCTSKVTMAGKTVIVTGANSGIGFYTAQDLAKRGARVILACRNEARGTHARDQIIANTGNTDVVFKQLDLASLSSVEKFCEDIIRTEKRLDVLVNNAGVYGLGYRYTDDGIIEAMQVNVFAPFLLTDLLLPMLKAHGGRIVNVSSLLHYIGNFKPDHINKKGYYHELLVYSNSKFCNVLFTVELARRLRGSGVTVNAVHPGIVRTNIAEYNSNIAVDIAFRILLWVCYRTAEEGAQGCVNLCVSEECAATTGKFFVDGAEWWPAWKCRNKIIARNLWDYAEKLLKHKLTNMKDVCQAS